MPISSFPDPCSAIHILVMILWWCYYTAWRASMHNLPMEHQKATKIPKIQKEWKCTAATGDTNCKGHTIARSYSESLQHNGQVWQMITKAKLLAASDASSYQWTITLPVSSIDGWECAGIPGVSAWDLQSPT